MPYTITPCRLQPTRLRRWSSSGRGPRVKCLRPGQSFRRCRRDLAHHLPALGDHGQFFLGNIKGFQDPVAPNEIVHVKEPRPAGVRHQPSTRPWPRRPEEVVLVWLRMAVFSQTPVPDPHPEIFRQVGDGAVRPAADAVILFGGMISFSF